MARDAAVQEIFDRTQAALELALVQDMYRIVKRRARDMISERLPRRACRMSAEIVARWERRAVARARRLAA